MILIFFSIPLLPSHSSCMVSVPLHPCVSSFSSHHFLYFSYWFGFSFFVFRFFHSIYFMVAAIPTTTTAQREQSSGRSRALARSQSSHIVQCIRTVHKCMATTAFIDVEEETERKTELELTCASSAHAISYCSAQEHYASQHTYTHVRRAAAFDGMPCTLGVYECELARARARVSARPSAVHIFIWYIRVYIEKWS